MTVASFHGVFILTGPTGSGKTRLAIELAQRLGAEIVSMDSMALYRGMDIGTDKPTLEARKLVPHHLLDVREPWESASVAWWLEQATRCCHEIAGRDKQVLFVGGTPLYLKALLRGLFQGPAADETLRGRLAAEARALGSQALHDRLARLDPLTAGRVHANDLRRIIRALEVLEITGRPISAWQQQWAKPALESRLQPANAGTATSRAVWLSLPRTELYARIDQRVRDMFAAGLVDEVQGLRRLERPLSRQARQALGYKEVLAHVAGQATLEETILEVQKRTRQFAKRQISWFRHLPELQPITWELTADLWNFKMTDKRIGD